VNAAAFDLARKILDAIEAKEAKARAALGGPWRHNPGKQWHHPDLLALPPEQRPVGEEFVHTIVLDTVVCVAATGPTGDLQSMADAAFIADNGPDEILRRCAGDRELVALLRTQDHHGPARYCRACQALHILARYYRVQP
jgi:hypothetical protein